MIRKSGEKVIVDVKGAVKIRFTNPQKDRVKDILKKQADY